MSAEQTVDTVVVGGGQAGLATGYHLRRRGRAFVILDAGPAVGQSWRGRWVSLRLFTPAGFSRLPGMAFPAAPAESPTKDAVAGSPWPAATSATCRRWAPGPTR